MDSIIRKVEKLIAIIKKGNVIITIRKMGNGQSDLLL